MSFVPTSAPEPRGLKGLLEVEHLSAGYGLLTVLHDIHLVVHEQEIVTLIGANGAGKSTLMATLMGVLPSSRGSIRYAGEEIAMERTDRIVRAGLALVPERRQLFAEMSVEENLLLGAHAVQACTARERLAQQYQPLYTARRAPPSTCRHVERRRAADGGDRACVDGEPTPAIAG